ncbi:hypothetical protein K8I31_16060 [bacterium]|nr:hypothetical protein [bacterium]
MNEDGIVNKLDLLLLQSVWNTISEVEIPTPTPTPEIQSTPTPLSQGTPISTHPFTGVYQAIISGDDFGSGSFTVDQYGKISGSTTTNNGFISLGGVIALDGSITFSYSDGVSLVGVGVGKVNDDGIGNGSWINIMGGRGTWDVTKQ